MNVTGNQTHQFETWLFITELQAKCHSLPRLLSFYGTSILSIIHYPDIQSGPSSSAVDGTYKVREIGALLFCWTVAISVDRFTTFSLLSVAPHHQSHRAVAHRRAPPRRPLTRVSLPHAAASTLVEPLCPYQH